MPLSEEHTVGEPTHVPVEQEAEQIPVINVIRIVTALVIFVLVCIGALVVFQRSQTSPPQVFVPPMEPPRALSPVTTQAVTSAPESPTVTVAVTRIPILSTEGWKQVSQNGVTFSVPSDFRCEPSEEDCRVLWYTWSFEGRAITSTISVEVQTYNGGSRRAQFQESNTEISNCRPLYAESLFGEVQALQIGSDGGWCQGGGGGIVAVVRDRLVIFHDLPYNSDTKQFPRFGVRDTIISTLR